jgi:hypothetical protein
MTTTQDERPESRWKPANDEPADSGIDEQQSIESTVVALQSKIAELEATNHRLRVSNVSLRSRYDALKFRKLFEKRVLVVSGLVAWAVSIFLVLVFTQARFSF